MNEWIYQNKTEKERERLLKNVLKKETKWINECA